MNRVAVLAGGVATPGGVSDPCTVIIEGERIASVAVGHDVGAATYGDPVDSVIDALADIVGPGLIDIHTHGGDGVQAIDGDVVALRRLSRYYAAHGVTGFLGTIGGSNSSIEAGLRGLTTLMAEGAPGGARCLGVHMEGPFISPCCPGAFRADSIVAPDVATFERYADMAGGALALITVAPDVAGTAGVIRAAVARGVVCSAGHSDATEQQALDSIRLGVRSMTHMFNAMRPLHHREPGIIGVGLTEPDVCVELIADGVHVHPRVVKLTVMAKGCDGIVLITDSIAAAGLDDGTYAFEEQQIVVEHGEARLADGTLAGSTLTMERAVRNLAEFAAVPWHESLISATVVPARLLGLGASKGRVAAGFDADLVGFDRTGDVCWTMVAGTIVFRR